MKNFNRFLLILISILSLQPAINSQSSELPVFWQKELDSIGIMHNRALSYAYNKLQTTDLTNLSESRITELTATFCSEFYTNRYGALLNFSQNDLKSEILSVGITPIDHNSLSISDQLKESISLIRSTLQNLGQTESSEDFGVMVTNIINENIDGLNENERIYLLAYEDLITKSFSYWDENIEDWGQLVGNGTTAKLNLELLQNDKYLFYSKDYHFDETKENTIFTLRNDQFYLNSNNTNLVFHQKRERHPCATVIASADGGGLFSGLIRGCITGALFGAGVGCIPAAIFWGGVQGVSGSIGAGVSCLAMQ